MTKAEKRALEAYPAKRGHLHDMPFLREGFIHGYEQAEREKNLTWEDVRRIVVISEDVFEEGNNLSEQEFYEEILRRFNEK